MRSRKANQERRTQFTKSTIAYSKPNQYALICPDCGKHCYWTKQDAKRASRQMYGQTLRAYRCGKWWHLTSQDAATTAKHRRAP